MQQPLPELRTERLLLRPITLDDVDAMQSYRGREDVARYLLHDPLSMEAARARVTRSVQRWSEYPAERFALNFAIELRSADSSDGDDTPIGDLNVWNVVPDAASRATANPRLFWMGYAMHPDSQGNGYAREAAACVVKWIFEHHNATEMRAIAMAPNAPSINLLRKLGFSMVERAEMIGSALPTEVELRLLASDWATQHTSMAPHAPKESEES